MPRKARIDVPGCLYHLIARGNERKNIFWDEKDYDDFLSRLEKGLADTGHKCLAWTLMPNHFHLLILRGPRLLSDLMRQLMTGYVVHFNRRHKRIGHLFQNRYKAILCDKDEYLMELVAYIHLNPVRAGIIRGCGEMSQYSRSGHNAMLGVSPAKFLDRDYVLQYFGQSRNEAVKNYEIFLRERAGKFKKGEYSGGGLARSMGGRENVSRPGRNCGEERFDERVLGSGDFVESVLKFENKHSQIKMSKEDVLREVERKTGVDAVRILHISREKDIVQAKALYCYLGKAKCGLLGTDLMREFSLSSGAISHLTRKGREIAENGY